jgi:hypothetical protein
VAGAGAGTFGSGAVLAAKNVLLVAGATYKGCSTATLVTYSWILITVDALDSLFHVCNAMHTENVKPMHVIKPICFQVLSITN